MALKKYPFLAERNFFAWPICLLWFVSGKHNILFSAKTVQKHSGNLF